MSSSQPARSLFLFFVLLAFGCATGANVGEVGPRIAPGARSIDGLYRVDHAKFEMVFVKPGANLNPYKKVLLSPVKLQYKGSAPGAVPLDDNEKDRMRRYFREALDTSLEKSSRYQLVKVPGADTLRLAASLVDIVVTEPRTKDATQTFVVSPGAMTLVVELSDSKTDEVLVRLGDRRAVQSDGELQSSLDNWPDIRTLFRNWADLIGRRLEVVHQLPSLPTDAASTTGS